MGNNDRQTPPKKRPPKKKSTNRNGGPETVFINIRLTKADADALGKVVLGAGDIENMIAEWAEDGYKFSISIDQKSDGFIASIYGKSCIEENRHKILTGRGATFENAVLSLWWKHTKHCDEGIFPGWDEAPDKSAFG